jgi:serine phosphatase RsbU (regulator of sigma subunit)
MIGLNSMLAPSTLVLPLVTILAFRVGPAGATVGGSVFALVANYATNAGHGYFAQLDTSPTNRLALLQVFIAILVIVGWSIGVEALGRIDAVTASVKIELERDEATAALRAIHRAIGPTNAATIGPFDVGSCYRQSQVSGLVGGDWFDAFALVQGRLMFVVGDVVGHGIDAMEDMAQLRLASRAFAMEGHTPSRILEELNVFTRNGTRGHFATMVVGIYEPSDQCLVVASAGHPPPLIRRSGWSSEYVAVAPGPPLGVSDHATYHGSALPLSGADVVVLYTDGVIERRGHPLDDGLRQLSELLDATDPNDPPDGICEQLIDRCFADVAALDDRCMLVIRVRG